MSENFILPCMLKSLALHNITSMPSTVLTVKSSPELLNEQGIQCAAPDGDGSGVRLGHLQGENLLAHGESDFAWVVELGARRLRAQRRVDCCECWRHIGGRWMFGQSAVHKDEREVGGKRRDCGMMPREAERSSLLYFSPIKKRWTAHATCSAQDGSNGPLLELLASSPRIGLD